MVVSKKSVFFMIAYQILMKHWTSILKVFGSLLVILYKKNSKFFPALLKEWLAGYYIRFVKGFSLIASPLTNLLHKNAKFDWNDKCQASFEKLKSMLTEVLVLTQPVSEKDFVIYRDAFTMG